MLSDLKRRIVAKERVTSQLAASSILPKSIWDRILNERPAASGRLVQVARASRRKSRWNELLSVYERDGGRYERLLVRGLGLPLDAARIVLDVLRKLRRDSSAAMDAWIAERSEGRIVNPQSGHDVNPSSWGHWLWRNMVRDSPTHLVVSRRRWWPEGGLDGGHY